MKLVTVSEMQAIEHEANAGGLTYEIMMENAGRGLAKEIEEIYHERKEAGVLGLVGSGNNGGDTLVALSYLAGWGWNATAYFVRPRLADDNLVTRLRQTGANLISVAEDLDYMQLNSLISTTGVLLDGVLGTGIKLPLQAKEAEVLGETRQALLGMEDPPCIIAVDLPSGVDGKSGEAAAESIPADLTMTMAAVKAGMLCFPAGKLIGELRVVDIGLTDQPSWLSIRQSVADLEMVRAILPDRPPDSHKGTFGTTLVVAGSLNYTGAALLSGKAAFRVGSGLITLAIPAPIHSALAGHFPESTWLLLPHDMGVISAEAADLVLKNLSRPTAMLIGPGLGLEDTTQDFLFRLIGAGPQNRRGGMGFLISAKDGLQVHTTKLPPLVFDADGLKLLARIPGWFTLLPAPAVLTPHPGEMGVLTGLPVSEIQSARLETAVRYAKEWGHVVVLKGAYTIIAAPDGESTVIPVATAALARAGTGDVLSGLIAGLLSQGVGAFPSAVAGCWIHAQAGLRAAENLGNTASVLAGDVLQAVTGVLNELMN